MFKYFSPVSTLVYCAVGKTCTQPFFLRLKRIMKKSFNIYFIEGFIIVCAISLI